MANIFFCEFESFVPYYPNIGTICFHRLLKKIMETKESINWLFFKLLRFLHFLDNLNY